MNSITWPSLEPDFLDRSLALWFRRLEEVRPDADINADFDRALPGVLGGILDLLVASLRVVKETPSPTEFRMADFARWGRAVAIVLGVGSDTFDSAYRDALQRQSNEILEQSPVALAVLEFMRKQEKVVGISRRELFQKLEEIAKTFGWFGEK